MGWQQKKSWNETVLLTVGDIDIILELPRDSGIKVPIRYTYKSVCTGVVPRLVIDSTKLLKFDSPCVSERYL